jgi:hypothetical protein
MLLDKPRTVILLDRSHPLARGLVCALPLIEPGAVAFSAVHRDRFTGTLAARGLQTTIEAAENAEWFNLTGGYTFCIWHGGMTFGDWQAIFSFNGSLGYAWQRYGSNTYFRVYHDGYNYNLSGLSTSDVADPGMLVCRWDGSTVKAYINGDEKASTACAIAPGTSSAAKLKLGSTGCYTAHFILVYERALRHEEIRQLYQEPLSLFTSGVAGVLATLGAGQTHTLSGSVTAASGLSAQASVSRTISGTTGAVGSVAASPRTIRLLAAECVASGDLAGVLTKTGVVTLTGVTGGVALLAGLLQLVSSGSPPGPSLKVPTPWRRDALFNGMTYTALQLGTVLTGGWFWTRPSGCSVVCRGASISEVDFTSILGVVGADARQIVLPAYLPHNVGSSYCYVVRRFNSCGHHEETLSASLRVTFGSNGAPVEPAPNNVFALHSELGDSNTIGLGWFYCPLDQDVAPAQFNVYWDSGTGQLDLETPLAELPYEGRRFYSYLSDPVAKGVYTFVVRAQSAAGVERVPGARLTRLVPETVPETVKLL